MDGSRYTDYEKCTVIFTRASLSGMFAPKKQVTLGFRMCRFAVWHSCVEGSTCNTHQQHWQPADNAQLYILAGESGLNRSEGSETHRHVACFLCLLLRRQAVRVIRSLTW